MRSHCIRVDPNAMAGLLYKEGDVRDRDTQTHHTMAGKTAT